MKVKNELVSLDDVHPFALKVATLVYPGCDKFGAFLEDFYPATPAEAVFRWASARELHSYPLEAWDNDVIVRRHFELFIGVYTIARNVAEAEIARRPPPADDGSPSPAPALVDTIYEKFEGIADREDFGPSTPQPIPAIAGESGSETASETLSGAVPDLGVSSLTADELVHADDGIALQAVAGSSAFSGEASEQAAVV